MVDIPESPISSVELIYKSYEEDEDTDFRDHLGASIIGLECDRRVWYSFRWATRSAHEGRLLRLFETGQREEARLTENLRRIGVSVQDVDPATHKQWQVRDSTGHFGGSLDGVGHGFPEAPKTEHVLEYKTHNDKSFRDLLKHGVKKSKPQHFVQMQIYMHLRKLTRAFYLAVNKNTDELYRERIHYDIDFSTRMAARAQRIIQDPNPPARITEDPSWYQCKMCNHNAVCHGKTVPERHCRSCMFSSPIDGGQWHCAKYDNLISPEKQRIGCISHRYLPSLLVGAVQIDADESCEWIEYKVNDIVWRDTGT